MKVNIKGKEFELHYSMRMYILYENIMGKSLSNGVQGTTTSMIVLMYCAILASIQYHKLNISLSYDDFMDWLDEQDASVFADFGKWFTDAVEAYSSVKSDDKDEPKDNKSTGSNPNP